MQVLTDVKVLLKCGQCGEAIIDPSREVSAHTGRELPPRRQLGQQELSETRAPSQDPGYCGPVSNTMKNAAAVSGYDILLFLLDTPKM